MKKTIRECYNLSHGKEGGSDIRSTEVSPRCRELTNRREVSSATWTHRGRSTSDPLTKPWDKDFILHNTQLLID